MKQVIRVLFLILVSHNYAQVNRRLCISVDDLPLVKYGVEVAGHEEAITNGIVEAFEQHRAPGVGYVNARSLFSNGNPDSARIGYLETWLRAGLDLGNHTYSHKNYNRVSFEEYAKDILDGEMVVKALVEGSGRNLPSLGTPTFEVGRIWKVRNS